MKKVFAVLMTLTLALALLAGCGNTATEEPAQEETAETAEAVETEETAAEFDADTAILVVSFGTSYNESRDATIGATEQARPSPARSSSTSWPSGTAWRSTT